MTVGMHSQGFERLIKKIDDIAVKINEDIIMQVGATKYLPKNVKYFNYMEFSEIQKFIQDSRIVICHGGAGSIIDALIEEKPVIVVPRLKKFKEVIDDHQLELANALANEKKILVIEDLNKLVDAINSPYIQNFNKIKKDDRLIKNLTNYINSLKK